MKLSPIWEITLYHVIFLLISGVFLAIFGITIEEFIAYDVLQIPDIVAVYGGIISSFLGIISFILSAYAFWRVIKISRSRQQEAADSNKELRRWFKYLPKAQGPFYGLVLVLVSLTGISMISNTTACHTIIDRPDDGAELKDPVRVKGRINDSDKCPAIQIWMRDLGNRNGQWAFMDEDIPKQNGEWGSRDISLKDEGFRGPGIEIRALGWRRFFGRDGPKSLVPYSYLPKAAGVGIEWRSQ